MTLTLRDVLPPESLSRYVEHRRRQGWCDEAIAVRLAQPLRETLQASVTADPLKEQQRWQKRRKRANRRETIAA